MGHTSRCLVDCAANNNSRTACSIGVGQELVALLVTSPSNAVVGWSCPFKAYLGGSASLCCATCCRTCADSALNIDKDASRNIDCRSSLDDEFRTLGNGNVTCECVCSTPCLGCNDCSGCSFVHCTCGWYSNQTDHQRCEKEPHKSYTFSNICKLHVHSSISVEGLNEYNTAPHLTLVKISIKDDNIKLLPVKVSNNNKKYHHIDAFNRRFHQIIDRAMHLLSTDHTLVLNHVENQNSSSLLMHVSRVQCMLLSIVHSV